MKNNNYWLIYVTFGLFSSQIIAKPVPSSNVPKMTYAKSAASNNQIDIGRRIYMEGILPSGKPLKGRRVNSLDVEGADAACQTCHRRSGMGSLEGNIVVPPITGGFLFAKPENRPVAIVDSRAPKNINRGHAPYSDKSFNLALTQGIRVDGRKLNSLMPQYDLKDNEVKALSTYVKQLSASLPAGVGKDTLNFATVIAPGVDRAKSDAMVAMMRTAFSQRNASQENYSGRMRMPMDLIPRQLRNWQLKVWKLQGEASTWEKQLADHYRKEPVFAVISGISNTTWTPIHNFCQQQKVPCMLPSVPLPPDKNDFYSLYYSRGVALEADVLAKHFRDRKADKPERLIQVYRDREPGKSAAQKVESALQSAGIKLENRIIKDTKGLITVLKDVAKEDAMMIWLNPADISAVVKTTPVLPTQVFLSGYMAAEDYQDIPENWRSQLQVIYPYELGDNRKKNEETLKHWLNTWHLPFINTAFQSEVFFNLLYLTDMVSQMVDNLFRDYMIERADDMLSVGTNYSAYPHLSLGRGQRFASKGAYIAKIGGDGKLTADSGWIVP